MKKTPLARLSGWMISGFFCLSACSPNGGNQEGKTEKSPKEAPVVMKEVERVAQQTERQEPSAAPVKKSQPLDSSPSSFRIPLLITGEPGTDEQVMYVGVPFPRDWRVGPVAVVDAEGHAVPSSARIMARWPESEAIRWMGVEFLGRPEGEYFVVPAADAKAKVIPELKVEARDSGYLVSTGGAGFEVPLSGPLLSNVWWNDSLVLENTQGDDLYAVDQNGMEGVAGLDQEEGQLVYETEREEREEGAPLLRAVFRREGWLVASDGQRLARHITRLIFSAGRPEVKMQQTLILTDNTGERWFREYGLRFRYAPSFRPGEVLFPGSEARDSGVVSVKLTQPGEEAFLFQEKAFFMSRMDPEEDCRFLIGRTTPAGNTEVLRTGTLAGNWIQARGQSLAVGVALRNLWQTFPKELAGSSEVMTVRLWAPRGGEEMDFRPEQVAARWPEDWFNEHYANQALRDRILRTDTNAMGMARTHDLLLKMGPSSEQGAMAKAAAQTQEPVVVLADPVWLRFTEAMGHFHPYDPVRFPREESFAESWFDQYMNVFRQWGDYGFFEFGNWPHVWYREAADGPLKGRWYPYVDRYPSYLDYGFYAHVWRMFVRSGIRKYFDAAEEVTRHRLDTNMVHWDHVQSDEELANRRGPRRLKGTYVGASIPAAWSGGSSFHHQGGTDLRALAYLYYVSDFRPAREMIGHYGDAVKRQWRTGNLGPLRGTRPFASLKSIVSAYQETGDPELRQIVEDQVEYLVDLDAPQGIGEDRELTRLAKYGVKAGALHRVWEVTGNELAARALLRGAQTRALTSMGENPFSYYNIEGEQLSAAYLLTGDPVYLRAMRRDLEVALSEFSDESGESWKNMWDGVATSMAGNVYPMGGMAFALDALAGVDEVELTPMAKQAGFGRLVLGAIQKPEGREVRVEIRSNRELDPTVYNAKAEPVREVQREAWNDQLYSRTKAATRWELTFPAGLPGGTYLIDSGGHGAMWEITWTDAPGVMLYAPRGFLAGPGGRQWGNRIMPGDRDHNPPLFFQLQEGATEFEIRTSGVVRITPPEGDAIEISPSSGNPWTKLKVPAESSNADGFWMLEVPVVTFVEFRGADPWVTLGDRRRWFAASLSPGAEAGLPGYLAPPPDELPIVDGLLRFDSNTTTGVYLGGGRHFLLPGSVLNRQEGTVECWIMPNWSSMESFGSRDGIRTLMDAGTWKVILHRYGEMSVTATVEADRKASQSTSALETNAGAALEKGVWTHLALQWKEVAGWFQWELFVDGRRQGFGIGRAGMPASAEGFVPAQPSEEIWFGVNQQGRLPLDCVLAGLRISSQARYAAPFTPQKKNTFERDEMTTELVLFDRGTPSRGRLVNP
jgi:hypothetical protein